MKNDMTKSYLLLNSLAAQGGIVIFGGSEDTNIPLSELKQAFALNSNFYNRSVDGLSVRNAGELYDLYVSALNPECLLLHIGDSDIDLFSENADKFDNLLRALIRHIKAHDRHCEIALISIRNPANADTINEMNRSIEELTEETSFEKILGKSDVVGRAKYTEQPPKDI